MVIQGVCTQLVPASVVIDGDRYFLSRDQAGLCQRCLYHRVSGGWCRCDWKQFWRRVVGFFCNRRAEDVGFWPDQREPGERAIDITALGAYSGVPYYGPERKLRY